MKKILLLFGLFIIILTIAILFFYKKEEKFYLDDKYYNNGSFISINSNDVNNIDSKNYVLFTYNNYCNFEKPCDQIFESFMKKYSIDFLYISFEEFKNTKFHDDIKYAPSVIIVKDNKVVKYLDAEKDEDIDKYQDVNKFEEWIGNYIYFNKD